MMMRLLKGGRWPMYLHARVATTCRRGGALDNQRRRESAGGAERLERCASRRPTRLPRLEHQQTPQKLFVVVRAG